MFLSEGKCWLDVYCLLIKKKTKFLVDQTFSPEYWHHSSPLYYSYIHLILTCVICKHFLRIPGKFCTWVYSRGQMGQDWPCIGRETYFPNGLSKWIVEYWVKHVETGCCHNISCMQHYLPNYIMYMNVTLKLRYGIVIYMKVIK